MAEISRKEAKVLLKDHEKWTNYSWIDDICEYAISDMEKLEKIEQIVFADDFDFANVPFVSIGKLREIEQIVKE